MKARLLSFCLVPLLAFSEDSTVTGTAQEKASEAVKPYDRLGRDKPYEHNIRAGAILPTTVIRHHGAATRAW